MSPIFKVIEHIIPGQHIREYPNALKHLQEDMLRLSVKQYSPLSGPDPVPEDAVTIIAAHGNGFPKRDAEIDEQEIYEPLWDDLYSQLRMRGVHIRNIWMADCTNQGASGVLNEEIQGDSTHWFDHSRDLLHMINHFRSSMPLPLIGVAHSMGCNQLIHLSTMHPRLLSTLLLYEPVIISHPTGSSPNPALPSTLRRDLWPSRASATKSLSKAFSTWDPRTLSLYLKHGLRSVPTPLFNPSIDKSIPADAVTLTTTKHQEAWAYAQPNWHPPELDERLLPDWDPVVERPREWARVESLAAFRELPQLRPSALFVFGGKRPLLPPKAQDEMVEVTGTGVGGSGGKGKGKVRKEVIEGTGHLVVFERVGEAAGVGAEWIVEWFEGWREEVRFWREFEGGKSEGGMLRVSGEWVERVKGPLDAPRRRGGKL
ncbi:MAG: hypothetical protein Q9227_008305 [Pyrenula ochraceoflavens]